MHSLVVFLGYFFYSYKFGKLDSNIIFSTTQRNCCECVVTSHFVMRISKNSISKSLVFQSWSFYLLLVTLKHLPWVGSSGSTLITHCVCLRQVPHQYLAASRRGRNRLGATAYLPRRWRRWSVQLSESLSVSFWSIPNKHGLWGVVWLINITVYI